MDISFLNRVDIKDVNGNQIRLQKGTIGKYINIVLGEFAVINGIKYPLPQIATKDYELN